jgi:pimeloyl-ACP methyl ester carboxylesterase
MNPRRLTLLAFTAFALTGCAQYSAVPRIPDAAGRSLREARSSQASVEERAALYVQAAADTAPLLEPGIGAGAAQDTYDAATAELTVLLRNADDGRLWNRPLTLTTGAKTYRLRFQPGTARTVWSPDYFNKFALASKVRENRIRKPDRLAGAGGALVGIRETTTPEPFTPSGGITAPVTAILDFHGHDATLSLRDPTRQSEARVAGTLRPLAADFSAPLAYYPTVNETLLGLMETLRADRYMTRSGLVQLQPYDSDRIPVIFIHGLISTPQIWLNVINEIEDDPELRGRFQFWVFGYPTGNPIASSALRLREELEKARKLYGLPHGVVLVGHSMGGLVARMQATTINAAAWEQVGGKPLAGVLKHLPANNRFREALIFNANPQVKRIVFICTPHRGSNMAMGSIGRIGMRLITLPLTIVGVVRDSLGTALFAMTNGTGRIPNGVSGLSPKALTLRVMDKLPINAPYHSIIGDRGKGDSPRSSDGVVAYWSSHLENAQSELIVPGPHNSYEIPQTIAELRRILHLHLSTIESNLVSRSQEQIAKPNE